MLVAIEVINADALDVIERRAVTHRVGNVAGAGRNNVFSKVTSAITLPPSCRPVIGLYFL
jgi:hypothetical protein